MSFKEPEELFDQIEQYRFDNRIIITSAKVCEKVINLKKSKFIDASILLFTSEKSI